MTEQVMNLLNTKNPGIVAYKTASQMGEDQVFDSFAEYVEYCEENPEAHRIIELEKVPELKGLSVSVAQNMFGQRQVVINGEKFTHSRLFRIYGY